MVVNAPSYETETLYALRLFSALSVTIPTVMNDPLEIVAPC